MSGLAEIVTSMVGFFLSWINMGGTQRGGDEE
jgi:hypothetical protein